MWKNMHTEYRNMKSLISELVLRIFGIEMILVAPLILLAYPLPPNPDILFFRIMAAALAGFLLIFGKKAVRVPFFVIASYGILVLMISSITAIAQ